MSMVGVKFVIFTPLTVSATLDNRAFRFCTELMREQYNKIYAQGGPCQRGQGHVTKYVN